MTRDVPTATIPVARQEQWNAAVSHLKACQHVSLDQLLTCVQACQPRLASIAPEWVRLAAHHKGISGTATATEEILAGPVVVQRFFRLLQQTLSDIRHTGLPRLPRPLAPTYPAQANSTQTDAAQWQATVFPSSAGLCDPLLFPFLSAQVRLLPGGVGSAAGRVPPVADELFSPWVQQLRTAGPSPGPLTLVLGAGNVSAIPITDCVSKMVCEGARVLLKLNPINAYLEPIWQHILQPFVAAGQLTIVAGDAQDGAYLCHHPDVEAIHITGSQATHDSIVWGADPTTAATRRAAQSPLLTKQITSELGNVTPWIVIPGHYRTAELESQAEHVAASLVNNAAFNCLATRVIVTARNWPQRADFLARIEKHLSQVPPRKAYYPGALERYNRFSGRTLPTTTESLPWTLLRDVNPETHSILFQEESFVCVCAETQLTASNPADFLAQAVEFCNDRLFGSLCAAITVPRGFRRAHRPVWEAALRQLRYGTVSLNQWPGTAYGIMATPWGGYPGTSLADIQSGQGFVHNTFMLGPIEKSLLSAGLITPTRPVWFPSHRRAEQVAWNLLKFYSDGRWSHLPAILWNALRP